VGAQARQSRPLSLAEGGSGAHFFIANIAGIANIANIGKLWLLTATS
jgi:hypothetical protein